MNKIAKKQQKKSTVTKSKQKTLDDAEDFVYYIDSSDEKETLRELGVNFSDFNTDDFNSY